MRMTLLAAVAAAGLAFVAVPAASAAPSYGAGVANVAPSVQPQDVRWVVRRPFHVRHVVVVHRGRHCWWRHGVRICN